MNNEKRLKLFEELQHGFDVDDVKSNICIADFPERIKPKTAKKLLEDETFIEEVARKYRKYLDDDDTWYRLLFDAFYNVLEEGDM